MNDFAPIEDYGLVGNLETCALVSRRGSVDWFPAPHLESPSLFAAVLDADRGGRFAIRPAARFDASRRYAESTNVLETTFETASGTAAVTDFMLPVELDAANAPTRAIYRRVTGLDGTVELEVEFAPRFDYARAETTVTVAEADATARARGGGDRALLWSDVDDDSFSIGREGDGATASVSLETDDTHWFVCCAGDRTIEDGDRCATALEATLEYWREWTHACDETGCVFGGQWHDVVVRSELVLKLLTHYQTGAIAAAPTTSLPEDVGGVRNWDYRYSWIRDSAFTVQALANLGHDREVRAYVEWFLALCHVDDPAEVQPLYSLHGGADLEERELPGLSGYRGSSPVRIGNDAAEQRQHDIYGELLLGVYELTRTGATIDRADWTALCGIVDHVVEVWDEPDAGIWEVRCEPRHFVHSKLLCWTALDRGIALAEETGYDAPLESWRDERETIRAEILDRGVDPERGCFVRAFDEPDAVDAATLLVPFVGFLPFDDPRVEATIEEIDERLGTDDGLVYRYDGDDGISGDEGPFLLCSFWLVNALALTGHYDEARGRFESLLEFVNSLGLLAEEVDRDTGAYLGNYPQAFSHIGLINSALYLARAAGEEVPGVEPVGLELGTGAVIRDP